MTKSNVIDFISKTAKDYDMSFGDVEHIYNTYRDTFYEELEYNLAIRTKRGESYGSCNTD